MVNLKRQVFFTIALRNGTQIEIDEELCFSSVKNATMYLEVHHLEQKGMMYIH